MFVFLANTGVPYGNGLTVSVSGIVIGGVLSSVIIGVGCYVIKRNRDLYKDTHEIKVALVGEKPSDLNPAPLPGLVEVVMGKDGTGGLVKTVAEHGVLLASLASGNASIISEQAKVANELGKA